MLPTMFQPKTSRHFIVKFDCIDSFLVKKFELPTLKTGKKSLCSRNPAKLFLHCPVVPSAEQQIQDAYKKQLLGQLNDCVVDFLDPGGTVIDKWTFTETNITGMKISNLDYSTSDLLEIVVLFTFSGIEFGL